MTYALRKLIAFVFLGGMLWFVYQDLDNLDKPWFKHALGLITLAFAVFVFLIPTVVVRLRIRRRCAQNRERHAKWLAEGGMERVKASAAPQSWLELAPGERVLFHEKGTFYVPRDADFPGDAGVAHFGRPSDVAFPGFHCDCRVAQRTHCYFTDRRVAFKGKQVDFGVPFAELESFSGTPGGIVFRAGRGHPAERFAFTFQNPLIAADVLRFAMKGGE